jgi:hypothetical protein
VGPYFSRTLNLRHLRNSVRFESGQRLAVKQLCRHTSPRHCRFLTVQTSFVPHNYTKSRARHNSDSNRSSQRSGAPTALPVVDRFTRPFLICGIRISFSKADTIFETRFCGLADRELPDHEILELPVNCQAMGSQVESRLIV